MKNKLIYILNEKAKEISLLENDENNKKIISLINMIVLISLSQSKIWTFNRISDLSCLTVKHILWIKEEKNLTLKQRNAINVYVDLIKANHIDDVRNLYKTELKHNELINKVKELLPNND